MMLVHRSFVLGVVAVLLSGTSAVADVFSNVPEASGYSLVYTLPIPATQYATFAQGFNFSAIPYTVDNSANWPAGSFDRVAYYLELSGSTDPTRPNGYVYVSFDKPSVFSPAMTSACRAWARTARVLPPTRRSRT